jgi:hypothetical protein
VWTDPPGLPTTAHDAALISDLDLEVIIGSTTTFGNSMYSLPSDVLRPDGHDKVNNVEVVKIVGEE